MPAGWAFIWFLCLLFEGNFVNVGKQMLVGAFVVIAVNTMMMALFGVMVCALAGTEVSASLTRVWGLPSWMSYMTGWCIDARCSEWYGRTRGRFCNDSLIVLEDFAKHSECGRGGCVKVVVTVVMVLNCSVFMCGHCYGNEQGS